MNESIDYFLFPNSPYVYLGHARLVQIARKHGATVNVKPKDAAKVFPVSGGLPLAKRAPQRLAYRRVELKRWRDHLGVPLNLEPKFFPVAGDAAARLIVAAGEISDAAALEVAGRVLKAVWVEDRNIADEATRVAIANEAGLDGAALLVRRQADDIGARYDAFTQQAIDRQVFGAPTYFYRDDWFWGRRQGFAKLSFALPQRRAPASARLLQDRLDFLERALAA